LAEVESISVFDARPFMSLAAAAGFAVLTALYCAVAQSHRPLWLDEACTYWTIHARPADLLRGARTDGSPPLYFLIVSAVTHLFGTGEFALRLTSMIAAVALVPTTYAVARLFATRRAAVFAAGLIAISPLVHYYAVDARNYELVQLETVAIVYFIHRAIVEPAKVRWWVLLSLSQTIQLWTHTFALFLLPVPAVACALAGRNIRWRLAVKAMAASACALTLSLPCVLSAIQEAGSGVTDWINAYWQETPPAVAILRSLEVFGFGGKYPSFLGYLGRAPAVRVLAVPTMAAIFGTALLGRPGRDRSGVRVLLACLFVPLVSAWAYSLVRTPLYLVGWGATTLSYCLCSWC
jgi:4-amino-4-deoxy-L-arabinose transferase-like glycosyltransferase